VRTSSRSIAWVVAHDGRTAIYARRHPRLNPHGRGDQRERSQIQSVDLRLSEPLDPTDSVEALPSAAVVTIAD